MENNYQLQEWQALEQKLTNASTSSEVNEIRQEAFHKKYFDLVNQGRQILISSFGFKKGTNGTLIPPMQIL